MKKLRILVVALLSLSYAGLATAAMYKWVDPQGQVHYSQTPPTGQQAERIAPPPPPPPAPPGATTAADGKTAAGTAEKEGKDGKAATQPESDPKVAAARAENCRRARANLRNLQTGGHNRFMDASGQVRYYTPEEMQAKIREAQQMIEKSCSPGDQEGQ